MDPSVDISPSIALGGILSGIFLVTFIILILHVRLLRRRRKAALGASRLSCQPQHTTAIGTNHNNHHDHDRDHESDLGSGSGSEKRSTTTFSVSVPSRASLNLEPNQPIFVDLVVVESADGHDGGGGGGGGPQAGLQFILTPPTPGK